MTRQYVRIGRVAALVSTMVLLASCGGGGHTNENVEILFNDLKSYAMVDVDGELKGGTINDLEIAVPNPYRYGDGPKNLFSVSYDKLKFDTYEVDGFGLPKRVKMHATGIEFDVPDMDDELRYLDDAERELMLDFFKADKEYSIDLTFDNGALNVESLQIKVKDLCEIEMSLDVEKFRLTMFGAFAPYGLPSQDSDMILPKINSAMIKVKIHKDLKKVLEDVFEDGEDEIEELTDGLREFGLEDYAKKVEGFVENPKGFEVSMGVDEDYTIADLFEKFEDFDVEDDLEDFLKKDLNLKVK